jgi:hypothetical protein
MTSGRCPFRHNRMRAGPAGWDVAACFCCLAGAKWLRAEASTPCAPSHRRTRLRLRRRGSDRSRSPVGLGFGQVLDRGSFRVIWSVIFLLEAQERTSRLAVPLSPSGAARPGRCPV